MSKLKKKSRKKSRVLRQFILLLVLMIILGVGYFYLKSYTHETPAVDSSVNRIQYTTLENPDSIKYIATIIYNKNVSINTISETFYKSDIYWPYIYIANKDVMQNPLNIEADIVLKIPRISEKILDQQDTTSVNKVRALADSILNSVTTPP